MTMPRRTKARAAQTWQLRLRTMPNRALLVVLLFAAVACFAQTQKYVAWHIQQGNGCSNTKTIATYFYPVNVCFGNSSNSYQCVTRHTAFHLIPDKLSF